MPSFIQRPRQSEKILCLRGIGVNRRQRNDCPISSPNLTWVAPPILRIKRYKMALMKNWPGKLRLISQHTQQPLTKSVSEVKTFLIPLVVQVEEVIINKEKIKTDVK